MERVYGLDLLRALAVLMVIAGHARFFLRALSPSAQELSIFGFLGVELFFVLSGFLIGGIVLRTFGDHPDHRTVLAFWIRRWFRTLPNYYLFLGIACTAFAGAESPSVASWASYGVFLQNLAWPAPSFFNESWSLAVEEWFYLLFPLLLIAASALGAGRRASVALSLGILFLFSTGARFWAVASGNPSWDEGVRKIVIFRFDALMVGVVAALWKEFHASSWERLRRPGIVAGALLFGCVAWSYYTLDRNGSTFARTFLFSITSVSVLCFLPVLDGWRTASGLVASAITRISLWSYSLYLCNLPVRSALISLFGDPEIASPAMSGPRILALTVAFVLGSIGVSAFVYRFFEKPATALRDRFGSN